MTSGLRRALAAPRAVELACWFHALLWPTVAFKARYLDRLFVGGAGLLDPPWAVPLHFAADAAEVLVLALAGLAVGRGLLGADAARVAGVGTLVGVLAAWANDVAQAQSGAFLSTDALRLATRWASDHPAAVPAFVPLRPLAGLGAGLAWSLAVAPAARRLRARAGPAARGLVASAAALALAGLALPLAARVAPDALPPATPGYWSTAAAAFAGRAGPEPAAGAPPTTPALEAERQAVLGPGPGAPDLLQAPPAAARRARHVLLVVLETAPRRHYPLDRAPDLPTFGRLARGGVTGAHHFTSAPASALALYALLTGVYPAPGPRPGAAWRGQIDVPAVGLPARLAALGFETTYVAASRTAYWEGSDRYPTTLRALGFATLAEAEPPDGTAGTWDALVAREARAFAMAVDRILAARARGRHAFVTLMTALGHFPWPAPAGAGALPASERVRGVARQLDALLGGALDTLRGAGLAEELVVVVTGDHGLRVRPEFESLGEPVAHGPLGFDVPFLLWAPALFPDPVRLPHATAHVDLAPTLLDLLGAAPPAVQHGGHVLDRRLGGRTALLLGYGLGPVDGYYRDGRVVSVNRVTGRVTERPLAADGGTAPAAVTPGDPGALARLRAADRLLADTARHLAGPRPGSR
jgi:hypothetical protein